MTSTLLAHLPDRHGKPYRWRKLLHDLFDGRSFEHVQRERVTVEDWPDLDQGHIDYGLNRVADHAELTSFPPGQYDVLRDEVIRADQRRRRVGTGERIPTSDQIIRVYLGEAEESSEITRTEAWNRALGEHGLDPQPKESWHARAVRLPEAIRRFYAQTGFLPTKKQLDAFARYFQFSREDWKGPWAEALDVGRSAIAEAGLPDPPPYRPRIDKQVWEDEQGSRPWDPRDARHRPKHYWTSEAMVLEKVGEFVRDEVGPGRPASQDRYQAWSAQSPERPSVMTLQRYGGLEKLVKRLSKPGELERARREAERLANPTAEEQAEREQERLAAIVAKPQCQKILELIRERGEVGAREIEQAIGWRKGTASNWPPYLRQAGLIVCTTESPVARNARYRLPGEQSEAEKAAAERRHREELLQHPNGQATWKLLQERGEVTSREVAEACGFHQGTASVWLRRLVELGWAERQDERKDGGGQKTVYRNLAEPSRATCEKRHLDVSDGDTRKHTRSPESTMSTKLDKSINCPYSDRQKEGWR